MGEMFSQYTKVGRIFGPGEDTNCLYPSEIIFLLSGPLNEFEAFNFAYMLCTYLFICW